MRYTGYGRDGYGDGVLPVTRNAVIKAIGRDVWLWLHARPGAANNALDWDWRICRTVDEAAAIAARGGYRVWLKVAEGGETRYVRFEEVKA